MIDKRPKITEPVRNLMAMTDEVVSAKYIAPIVRMSESVIIHYAKTGQWQLSKYVISGNRVKFFREDFLRQCGYLTESEPEKNVPQLLAEIVKELKLMNKLMNEKEKTASAATLTEERVGEQNVPRKV